MLLNSSQKEAVQWTEGRLLVLAGAGSGKTRVIVQRIAHLIREKGTLPSAILGLTFTNKAAEEMRERMKALIGEDRANQVTLSTFHSFCMQVLRKDIARLGYTKNFSIYDERDIHRLSLTLARDMLGMKELPPLPRDGKDKFSQELNQKMQSALRGLNAVSFDNLILLTIRLFEEHPEVLNAYQERFRYLMIDEYQDTNTSQFRLAELLAQKYGNLCVVGDDDQSIYGWRGAKVDHILHFEADKIIKLEQNYRSSSLILEAANAVIHHNQNRHKKKLWSAQTNGDAIEVFNAPTEADEAAAIVSRLLKLKDLGLKWRDMAILYRSNALSRQLETALSGASWKKDNGWVRGIPYEVFGGLEFSERAEIKDLFAYLRVIANPRDDEALLRILNVPRRGISEPFLDLLTQTNRSEKIPLWQVLSDVASGKRQYANHPRGISGIISFVEMMEIARAKFENGPMAHALTWLLEESNYKKAIEEEVKSEKMRLFKWENVQECVNAIAQYEKEAENPYLADFIAHSSLGKPQFPSEKKRGDNVQLMTLHSAKGLEFTACFIVGLEDHILPHEKSVLDVGIEEERRLFYVGITRAKRFLTLSMARTRMRMGKGYPTNPSRFLFEIPKTLLKATNHKL